MSLNDKLYDIYYDISNLIFLYRMENDLSKKELAELMDISVGMINNFESGDYEYTVKQILDILQQTGHTLNIVFKKEE